MRKVGVDAEITKLAAKGDRNLQAAREQLRNGHTDVAVSRGYYAMFYYATALLLTKNLRLSKHSAVISAFGEHFAKPQLVPQYLHRKLMDAFELRSTGDYEYMEEISLQEAEELLKDAEEFISEIKRQLLSAIGE